MIGALISAPYQTNREEAYKLNYPIFVTTRYTLGNGSLAKIGEYSNGKVALIVDSRIIGALGLNERLYHEILKDTQYQIICDVDKEPTMEMLKAPIARMREFAPKYIVAIGGGSVMDMAKALWLFYELPHYNWEKAFAAYEVETFPGKATLTVVPTTSGTGSETTGCSVIKDDQNKKRMILSNEILPTYAIMDFDLLKSLPKKVIAYSGTDALAHAIEAATSTLASEYVRMAACQAAVTLIRQLPESAAGSLEARERVHIAATMAGTAINNAITGMAHGMDGAGGDFNLPHGLVTGMLLPYTMSYIKPHPFYEEMACQLGIMGSGKQDKLIDMIVEMYKAIGMPLTLTEAGVDEKAYLENIPKYIERAKTDANILFAPKQPTEQELKTLFKQFYYGL